MTELSPAAQAVLDAATPALNNLDACGFNHQRYDRKALAAALRAVAWQLREAYENEECVPSADDWLDDLATELENQ